MLGLPLSFALVALFIAGSALAGVEAGDRGVAPFDAGERRTVESVAEDQTLRLSARTCDGLLRGSGFVVEGALLTNAHLVAGAAEVKLDRSTAPRLARVAARNVGLDAAIVELDVSSVSDDLRWSTSDPASGMPVMLAGHPGGQGFATVDAVVQLRDTGRPWGIDGDVLLIDAQTVGGFSGGPVLDRRGDVVAMLHGFDATTGLTVAIPAAELTEWLESGTIASEIEPKC